MKVIIYARVSTVIQDYDRQIDELKDYAKRMNYQVVRIFSEKVSGAKKVAERNALSELLDYVRNSKVDKVLIYECSRLSRRIVDFLQVIEELNEQKVSLYIHQNGLETLLEDGSINPIACCSEPDDGCSNNNRSYRRCAHLRCWQPSPD